MISSTYSWNQIKYIARCLSELGKSWPQRQRKSHWKNKKRCLNWNQQHPLNIPGISFCRKHSELIVELLNCHHRSGSAGRTGIFAHVKKLNPFRKTGFVLLMVKVTSLFWRSQRQRRFRRSSEPEFISASCYQQQQQQQKQKKKRGFSVAWTPAGKGENKQRSRILPRVASCITSLKITYTCQKHSSSATAVCRKPQWQSFRQCWVPKVAPASEK